MRLPLRLVLLFLVLAIGTAFVVFLRDNHGTRSGYGSVGGGAHAGEEQHLQRMVAQVDSLTDETRRKIDALTDLSKQIEELERQQQQQQPQQQQPQQEQHQQQPPQQQEGHPQEEHQQLHDPSHPDVVAAIVVVACNRPSVQRSLELLLKYNPDQRRFPIVVTQDCGDAKTAATIRKFADRGVDHIQQPDLSEPGLEPRFANMAGYYRIARHYKWFLTQMFEVRKYDAIVIVEDDLDVAPDFYEYFEAGKRLLQKDRTLWCISAWNDNGKEGYVQDEEQLYRSDFFGGLGWMMLRSLWTQELSNKWPASFWDDWMREHEQRQGRACIRPEVSRTRTFGRIGVSRGQFFDKYLKYIKLSDANIKFTQKDMSYLLKGNYDLTFLEEVYIKAQLVPVDAVAQGTGADLVRIEYDAARTGAFEAIARRLGIMNDFKDGVPRTAYYGVVTFRFQGSKVHLAPKRPWKGYIH